MLASIVQYSAAVILIGNQALAAELSSAFPFPTCAGPDGGADTTVVTIPANQSVDVFHYRARPLGSVIEFCVRESGTKWTLVAAHGTNEREWSLLQSWSFPKAVQIKTRAYANDGGALYPFKDQKRMKVTYGYSFIWFDVDPSDFNDQIVYCYMGEVGCPASRRTDFP
jgi:hypothetical protein